MKITQIRNATLVIEYFGTRFLIDPLLAAKDAYPGFEGSHNAHLRQPIVDLPMTIDEVINVDAVIVTHLHLDHWDDVARNVLPRSMPIFVQNAADADAISVSGFTDVRILDGSTEFRGIGLSKTEGRHSTDAAYEVVGSVLGEVCGVVLSHPTERKTYLVGDCILDDQTRGNLQRFNPDVVVVNSGDGAFVGLDPILMTKEDVVEVLRLLPESTLVATHMEGIGLTRLSRRDLHEHLAARQLRHRALIPADGETVVL